MLKPRQDPSVSPVPQRSWPLFGNPRVPEGALADFEIGYPISLCSLGANPACNMGSPTELVASPLDGGELDIVEEAATHDAGQRLSAQTASGERCPLTPSELRSEVLYELLTPLTSIRGALGLLSNGSLGNLSPEGQRMVEIALKNTERMMRLSKTIEHSGESHLVSSEDLARLRLESDLHQALTRQETRQELFLTYQPIVHLETGKIIGFESLVRWQHPTLGLISPDRFIPLAEKTGLIQSLGEWVLATACQQLHQWHQEFPDRPPLTVSVNFSGKQLICLDCVDRVRDILAKTKIDPHCLRLEVTESAMMDNPQAAACALFELQRLGIQIYIDDFGTGYSSLSRLHELPIDVLKIDRSFVDSMCSELVKMQIIRSIITLAWNLGMGVIAEGVESIEQVMQLRILGCNFGQGYLFSKPLEATAASEFLADNGGNLAKNFANLGPG